MMWQIQSLVQEVHPIVAPWLAVLMAWLEGTRGANLTFAALVLWGAFGPWGRASAIAAAIVHVLLAFA